MNDLAAAIKANMTALHLIPEDHPARPACLHNHGTALQHRFERVGKKLGLMDDLHAAIDAKKEALELTPKDHPDRVIYLNGLGTLLRRRFDMSRSTVDLDTAVKMMKKVIEATVLMSQRAKADLRCSNRIQEGSCQIDSK